MKRLIALMLLVCMVLCLTACGSSATTVEEYTEDETTESTATDTAVEADPDVPEEAEEIPTEIPAEAEEDIIAYLTDGAYNSDSVIASTASGEMSMQDVLYEAAYQYMYYSYMYSMYGMTLNLSDDAGDGTTVADYLMNYGRSSAVDMLAAYSKAVEMGITLTEEDEATLATLTEDNITSGGESLWDYYVSAGTISEDDYDDAAKEAWIQEHGAPYYEASMLAYGCTAESYLTMTEKYLYINELQNYLFGDEGIYTLSDEEASGEIASYVDENGVIWGRCILFSTMDAEDDTEIESIAAQAQEAYDTLAALSGDELSEEFTNLQTEYDESGYTAGEVQYYTNADSLVDGYYDGLASLEPGQVGITGQTDYGYFILLREEDNTDDIADTVESNYMSETYYALLDSWIEEYGLSIEDIVPDVDAMTLMTKLGELQTIVGNMEF